MNYSNDTNPGTTFSFIPELQQLVDEIDGAQNVIELPIETNESITKYANKDAFNNAIKLREQLLKTYLADKVIEMTAHNQLDAEKEMLEQANMLQHDQTVKNEIAVIETSLKDNSTNIKSTVAPAPIAKQAASVTKKNHSILSFIIYLAMLLSSIYLFITQVL